MFYLHYILAQHVVELHMLDLHGLKGRLTQRPHYKGQNGIRFHRRNHRMRDQLDVYNRIDHLGDLDSQIESYLLLHNQPTL